MIDTECIHHWMVESPNGPISEGVCKKCDQIKQFNNSENIKNRGRKNPSTGTVTYTPDIVINASWYVQEWTAPS